MKEYLDKFGGLASYHKLDKDLLIFAGKVTELLQDREILDKRVTVDFFSVETMFSLGGAYAFISTRNADGGLDPHKICIPNNLAAIERYQKEETEFSKSVQRQTNIDITVLSPSTWSLLHEVGHAIDVQKQKIYMSDVDLKLYSNVIGDDKCYFDLKEEVSATKNAVELLKIDGLIEELQEIEDTYPLVKRLWDMLDINEIQAHRGEMI